MLLFFVLLITVDVLKEDVTWFLPNNGITKG